MSYLLLFQFSIRHSLTSKALQELLHLLSIFMPNAALPKSVYQLKSFFIDVFPEQSPTIQKYCTNCHRLLNEDGVLPCNCDAGYSQFITVSIASQLKARLEGK